MKTSLLGALTLLNLLLLIGLLSQTHTAVAQTSPTSSGRDHGQLVDERGQSRATMTVSPGGEAVFRLRDRSGTIRVKLSAGEGGADLLLLNRDTEPGVQVDGDEGTVTLTTRSGRKRAITP